MLSVGVCYALNKELAKHHKYSEESAVLKWGTQFVKTLRNEGVDGVGEAVENSLKGSEFKKLLGSAETIYEGVVA